MRIVIFVGLAVSRLPSPLQGLYGERLNLGIDDGGLPHAGRFRKSATKQSP